MAGVSKHLDRYGASRDARATTVVRLGIDRKIAYPEALPITARREELIAAIRDNQVVIVAGETGSGKSTQLPKLCIEAGRGVDGMIGHTQPRRVAARTIAERVAEELGTTIGDGVGYTVRFNDRVSDSTLVRIMTDGILLNELQRDRMLRRYDTIIVDEAHERSLNIDFILGYLKQLLPKRPDLKVIVTSATIDTSRFAEHFAANGIPAPVFVVEGRTFPVEMRYRPLGSEVPGGVERDQVAGIIDAVAELEREGQGDVLVFLSGEREIHDVADALRRLELRNTEVLALYARLSSVEQHRIFEEHTGRRIVLSTNVAETSITVPGVRYVVDAGTARISRYSRRLKIQRLPIEPVSKASANQRAGRCGRVAPGICIRLYSNKDFDARTEFTEPEILRTNLASVILQMTSLDLGDVTKFPFVEPPDQAAVRDGYMLLEELGALEAGAIGQPRRLTLIGRRIARLPIDPRLARMVVEAGKRGAVREVLVITSALSIQDVREHPRTDPERAVEFHRRFNVAGSDLLSIVALWDYLRDRQRELSGNQFRRLCRDEHLNYLRVREWRDLYAQLRQVAGQLEIRPGVDQAHPDNIHRSVLAGLLSHIGMRDGEKQAFRGARDAIFAIAKGSVVAKQPPRWVMASELVETNRLWARRVAEIKPEWAEALGAHLLKRTTSEPWWDARSGRAATSENVMLYGLPIVSNRTIGLDRVDPSLARQMFIRNALVDREWESRHEFLERNEHFVERVRLLEARVRRSDLLDADAMFDFYDERLGNDIVSGRHFDKWWKETRNANADLLDLTPATLADRRGIRFDDYPDSWPLGDTPIPITYRFDPGTALDGATLNVPLESLNQLSNLGFDWLIGGYRNELVGSLVRSLPKELRRALIPMAETIEAVCERLGNPDGRLVDALAVILSEAAGQTVDPGDFDSAVLPTFLRLHIVVIDSDARVIDAGDDLESIQRRQATATRSAIAAEGPIAERREITMWDFETLDSVVEHRSGNGVIVRSYPTLLDCGQSVSLRIVDNVALQQRAMLGGVRRLLILTGDLTSAKLERTLDHRLRLAVAGGQISLSDLLDDCLEAAVDAVMAQSEIPWDEASFRGLQRAVRTDAGQIAADALAVGAEIIGAATRVRKRTGALPGAQTAETVADVQDHLGRLVSSGFVSRSGTHRLPAVHRYVKGIEYRLDRLAGDVARDKRRMTEVRPLERDYAAFVNATPVASNEVRELGWMLEELRMSVFAQPLGVVGRVGAQRIRRAFEDATNAR